MDPNATLALIRDLLTEARGLEGSADADARRLETLDQLAEHTENLDEWLTKSGYLPQDWQKGAAIEQARAVQQAYNEGYDAGYDACAKDYTRAEDHAYNEGYNACAEDYA